MKKQKHFEISAVHEENLLELIKGLDLLKDLEAGIIRCKFCGKKITPQNLQSLYPENNEVIFVCDNIECFEQALKDSSREDGDV